MKPKNLENQPDFKNINITTEDPKEYSWQERRTEIYRMIIQKGYPDLNRAELSKRYGVSRVQISHDISILQKYIAQHNDLDEFVSTGKLNWKKGIEKLQKKGEYVKADKLWNSWKNFLYEDGVREKEPDKKEIKGVDEFIKSISEETSSFLDEIEGEDKDEG